MITREGEEVGVGGRGGTRVTVQLSSGELREVNRHLVMFKYINATETKDILLSRGIPRLHSLLLAHLCWYLLKI